MRDDASQVVWFDRVGREDVSRVGGKNASLGEMVVRLKDQGIAVPPGFATTAGAYWSFISANNLERVIKDKLASMEAGDLSLSAAGQAIRDAFLEGSWPSQTEAAIKTAYKELCEKTGRPDADVAVRSSATAEDLP